MLFSPVHIFISFSLTRSLTPSHRPSLPHLSEPSRLYFRISSSLPASLNLPSILNFSLPLSLSPFSDFLFSFSDFVRSPQSFLFALFIFDSISFKFLSHASAQSHQQSSLLETSRSFSFSFSLTSLPRLLSNFILSLSFRLSPNRAPLFLYLSLYHSFFFHFLFFLFPDRASNIPFSSSPVFHLMFSYSFNLSSPSLIPFCSIADPSRTPSFFRSLFVSLFLSQSHFLSPSQYFLQFLSLPLSVSLSSFLHISLSLPLSLLPSLSRLLIVFISFPLPFFYSKIHLSRTLLNSLLLFSHSLSPELFYITFPLFKSLSLNLSLKTFFLFISFQLSIFLPKSFSSLSLSP